MRMLYDFCDIKAMVGDLQEHLEENFIAMTTEMKEFSGLDRNALLGDFYVSPDMIIAGSPEAARNIEIYGKFEYIDPKCKIVVGDLTFYNKQSAMVASVLEEIEDLILAALDERQTLS